MATLGSGIACFAASTLVVSERLLICSERRCSDFRISATSESRIRPLTSRMRAPRQMTPACAFGHTETRVERFREYRLVAEEHENPENTEHQTADHHDKRKQSSEHINPVS